MIRRNSHFAHLKAGYLFPEIARRRKQFSAAHPEAHVISLGVGNTTESLTPHITGGLMEEVRRLGTSSGYTGYGDEQGLSALREKIADTFYKTADGKILADASEVFISDGAKCDIGRIQQVVGSGVSVAVQDPPYPGDVDGSVMTGAAGAYGENGYEGITYMPCTPGNGFFPDLDAVKENSLIYFCSPNNPTGAAAAYDQLEQLVRTARAKGCIIIFDSAYSFFIRDDSLPRSVFEIPGAETCAIEISSFSKPAGFTGVRLGWSVVPKALLFEDGTPVSADWNRVMTTFFNGASNIAQYGGLAALDAEGLAEMRSLTDFYLENASIIRRTVCGKNFSGAGVEVFGGDNAPYVWVRFPGRASWDVFDTILNECHVVTTPGSGFGPAGESFIRFSAFGHRGDIEEACRRLEKLTFR